MSNAPDTQTTLLESLANTEAEAVLRLAEARREIAEVRHQLATEQGEHAITAGSRRDPVHPALEAPCLSVPTVHSNGTSGEALLDQVTGAMAAIRAAMDAMTEASPHARDYYTRGPHRLTQALVEHESRNARLRSVLVEYETISESIANNVS